MRLRFWKRPRPALVTEELRCIYCQRTLDWPVCFFYPMACPHCGGYRGLYASKRSR